MGGWAVPVPEARQAMFYDSLTGEVIEAEVVARAIVRERLRIADWLDQHDDRHDGPGTVRRLAHRLRKGDTA